MRWARLVRHAVPPLQLVRAPTLKFRPAVAHHDTLPRTLDLGRGYATTGRTRSKPSPEPEQPRSSVARGTAFELLCGDVLSSVFDMQLERSGGAGDRGIDLTGWWNVLDRRVRVLAQCKCQDIGGKKIGPVIIREVEGVLHRASASGEHAVGVVLSSSGFSKQALLQVKSSSLPMMLMHVQPDDGTNVAAENRCLAMVWNDQLGSKEGLLKGEFEVRWERSLSASAQGKPAVYHYGQRYLVSKKSH